MRTVSDKNVARIGIVLAIYGFWGRHACTAFALSELLVIPVLAPAASQACGKTIACKTTTKALVHVHPNYIQVS